MNEANYLFIHGWVDDVVRDAEARDAHRIRVRQSDGHIADLALGQLDHPIRLGDEVSVVVEHARPGQVLVLVDHTTGEWTNYLCREEDPWPGAQDILLIVVTAGAFALALGGWAVFATLAFVLSFWMVAAWLPRRRRDRAAALVDYLIDREYCRWRAGVARQGSAL